MRISREQQKQGQEFMQTLIAKAWEDPAFKTALVANPEATIATFTGKDFSVPEGTTFVVQDQTDPSIIYLNIPRKVSYDDFELTDEQLEVVAGGEVGVALGIGIAACFLAGVGIGVALAK